MESKYFVVLEPSEQSGHVEMTVHKVKGSSISLAELQEGVGGYIEAVYGGPLTLFCHEEGKLKRQPYNEVATELWQMLLEESGIGMVPDCLVGRVVVTGDTDKDGEQMGLDREGLLKFGEMMLGNAQEFVASIEELDRDLNA